MKQDEYSTANKFWNAGAKEVQQLNPGEPDQRQIMMKCKHHESHITFGIEPNGQTQKWEHTSVQAHW